MPQSGGCWSFPSLEARYRWLADYQLGSLELEEERHLEHHLEECRACDAALGVLRHQLTKVEEAVHAGVWVKS